MTSPKITLKRKGNSMKNLFKSCMAVVLMMAIFLASTTTETAFAATLKNGSKGTQVLWLQRNLVGIGFGDEIGTIDSHYGNKTKASVMKAQSYFGISRDGIAGPETLRHINALVIEIQTYLQKLGYNISIDGQYGDNTTNAVKSYQQARGLAVTGIADETTRNMMKSEIQGRTIQDGIYSISPQCAPGLVLDCAAVSTENEANVCIWTNGNQDNQKLKVEYIGNGYYRLLFVHSGKALDVSGGRTELGTNVWQYEWNNTYAQYWKIVKAEDNYYYLISATGNYLDVCNAESNNGTNVWVYTGNGTSAQKWKLTLCVSDSSTMRTQFEEAVYNLAKAQLGKNYSTYVNPVTDWCGYYADWILKNAYAQMGYTNYRDYIPQLYSTSAAGVAYQTGNYGEYYSFTNWKKVKSDGVRIGKISENRNACVPKVGDIILVETNGNLPDGPDHVAIIIKVNADGSFVTSEGNTDTNLPIEKRVVREYTYVKSGETWQRKGCSRDMCKVHMICSVKLPN